MLHRLFLAADIAIRAPNLLARFLIECGDVLLFLIIVHDNQQVPSQRG
jgi:hypothetical protein